jgi:hypothetical protein
MAIVSPCTRRLAGLALTLACAAGPAAALSPAEVTHIAIDTCTGTRQTVTSPSSYLITCTDHLTLANGSITSDTDLVIDSTTSLTLMNVRIVAPSVTLRANSSVSIDSSVVFVVQSGVLIQGGEITSGAPGTVSTPPATSIGSGALISIGGAAAGQIALSGSGTGTQIVAAVSSPASDVQASPTGSINLLPADPPTPQPASGGGGALGVLDLAALLAMLAWAARAATSGQRGA